MQRNFTVVLTEDEAARVRGLLGSFGASVGGFAAGLVRDFLRLTPDQVHAIRLQVRDMGDTNERHRGGFKFREAPPSIAGNDVGTVRPRK